LDRAGGSAQSVSEAHAGAVGGVWRCGKCDGANVPEHKWEERSQTYLSRLWKSNVRATGEVRALLPGQGSLLQGQGGSR